MDRSPKPTILRRFVVVTSVSIAAAVIMVSAVMLATSARLSQASDDNAPAPAASGKSVLNVVPPSADEATAITNTEAAAALQGTAAVTNPSSSALSSTNTPVTVEPLPPAQSRTCDVARKTSLLSKYTADKSAENSYHTQMLSLFGLESILLQSSELTRHNSVLASLESSLSKSLAAIYCS